MSESEIGKGTSARAPLGGMALALIVVFHAAAVTFATYPAVRSFRSAIPANPDAWQHLWIMRWYKTCLLEGRSVFLCPELQYPVGAPLGNFSPLHFQSLLYVPLSCIIANDALCYNILWMTGLLLTGLGTSLLAWHVLSDRGCAAFAGLLAMLSAPMMIHASAHLELIYVGWFPIFLIWWMKFADQPSRGRLALAALGYVLVAMSAAYFMVFAVFPAALYVVWSAWRCGLRGAMPWLLRRAPWFLGMAAVTLPSILVLFSGHLWAIMHGFTLERSRAEFNNYGAPLWGLLAPTARHRFGTWLGFDPYEVLGPSAMERVPYLGMVTVILLPFAAALRSGLRRASYVWLTFALLTVLALGASWKLGGREISLPSSWLWDVFPPYRMTRVPARISLFVGVLAGILAAAGLKDLMARLPGKTLRALVFAGLAVVAIVDLAMKGFPRSPIPRMPDCYAFLKERDPKARLLEIPYMAAGGADLCGECTYWQSLHRLTTSAGYSGHDNAVQESVIGNNCPFQAATLTRPEFLQDAGKVDIGLLADVDFKDYVWIYLTVNRFDYVVLHHCAGAVPEYKVSLDRIKVLLRDCQIYADADSIIYDRSLLKPPSHPVHVSLGEWRARDLWHGRWNSLIPDTGRIAVYAPDSKQDLSLVIDAAPIRRSRVVGLRAGSRPLAQWQLAPGTYHHCISPPFRLPAGLHELTIETRTARGSPDRRVAEARDDRPYSLRVARVSLSAAAATDSIAVRSRKEALVSASEIK
jgi:hypothetical protein